jgi:hypothetical protein
MYYAEAAELLGSSDCPSPAGLQQVRRKTHRSAQRAEEIADVRDDGLRFLPGCIVSAAGHFAICFQFYPYVITYTSSTGKKKRLRQSLASDEEAKTWARLVVEQAGGGTAEPPRQLRI